MSQLEELSSIEFVIGLTADELKQFRDEWAKTQSGPIENCIRENEGKIVQLFARILLGKAELSSLDTDTQSIAKDFGSLNKWLDVVNLSPASRDGLLREFPSGDLLALLDSPSQELDRLCTAANVYGEEKRRFIKATRNLAWYLKKWVDEKQQPKVNASELCWMWNRLAVVGEVHRRSTSESGMDSGASDSGVGSNVSQNSLPTTTPPPSPGFLNTANDSLSTSTLSADSGTGSVAWLDPRRKPTPPSLQGYSMAQAGNGKSGKTPSTPPPTHRLWGNATLAAVASNSLPRSRSHEFNRIQPIANVFPLGSKYLAYDGSNKRGGLQASASECANLASHEGSASPLAKSPPYPYRDPHLSPTDVRPGPPSPRLGALTFKIPHKWEKRRPGPRVFGEECHYCHSPLGVLQPHYKCKASNCKIKVHDRCREPSGDTCGMTREMQRMFREYIQTNQFPPGVPSGSSSPPAVGHPRTWSMGNSQGRPQLSVLGKGAEQLQQQPRKCSEPATAVAAAMCASKSDNLLVTGMVNQTDSASSSSCNSSAPSTPAPGAPPQRSPAAFMLRPKFDFDHVETVPEIPDINIENEPFVAAGLGSVLSLDSDATVSAKTGSLAESDKTMSTDSQEQDDNGNDDALGDYDWPKRKERWFNRSTIRGPSSWTEWTIPFKNIKNLNSDDSLIGRGRFGEVRRGYWYQPVAVKLLNMDHVENEKQLEAFKQESRHFSQTRHENLILFLGCCMDPPKLGIVMNLCSGSTLYQHLHVRHEKFDMQRAVNIATQVAVGVSYLHQRSIVHKDLRSKNIFLEGPTSSKVVITDFGLFSMRRLFSVQTKASYRALHVPEHWLCYLAPEIMKGLQAFYAGKDVEELPFSTETDVYAFGTIWYELLTNEFPFKRLPPEAIVWQVGRGIKPPISNPQIPKEVKDILVQCWMFKAGDRPDFSQLHKSFEKLPKKRLTRSPSHPVHLSRSAESMF